MRRSLLGMRVESIQFNVVNASFQTRVNQLGDGLQPTRPERSPDK